MSVDSKKSLSAYARSSAGGQARAVRVHEPVDLVDHRYRVRKVLGRGGMGTVLLAEDLRLGREVAVKLLAPELTHTDTLRKRFLEEARAMGGLRHDHVAQVYSYGTHGVEPYIVMEYVPGETVVELVERARPALDLDIAVRVVDQIARGLAAIHAAGIIHGDIKPSNVLIGPRVRAVVVDFGLMRWLGDAEDLSIVIGTPAYIPPEVVKADLIELRLTPAADVFALGVTAFEMLTNRLPFVVTNVDELFAVHLSNARAPSIRSLRPDLPPAFDEVFARVLSGDLSERFRSADDFRRALLAARASASPSSRRTSIALALRDADERTRFASELGDVAPDVSIRLASSFREIVDLVSRSEVEIVVADHDLVVNGGSHRIADIRSRSVGDRVEVLVLGDDASPSEHRRFRDAGATGYLPKPVDAATVAGFVRGLVDH